MGGDLDSRRPLIGPVAHRAVAPAHKWVHHGVATVGVTERGGVSECAPFGVTVATVEDPASDPETKHDAEQNNVSYRYTNEVERDPDRRKKTFGDRPRGSRGKGWEFFKDSHGTSIAVLTVNN